MQTIALYKYKRECGGITVSPIEPDTEYIEMYRIIADEGKLLTNGNVTTSCIDIDSLANLEDWCEIDDPEAIVEEIEEETTETEIDAEYTEVFTPVAEVI